MDRKLNNYWVGFGAVVTIMLGGFWFIQTKLTSPRPNDPSAAESLSDQYPRKASIRLWQDPLECITKKSGENDKNPPISHDRIFDDIKTDFKEKFPVLPPSIPKARKASKILLLGVMIPGRHYTDRAERRIRCRKAVIDGLAESNYIPLDSEEMGYFSFTPWKESEEEQNDQTITKSTNQKLNLTFDSTNTKTNLALGSTKLALDSKNLKTSLFLDSTDSSPTPQADNIRVPFEWFQKIPSSNPLTVEDKRNSSARNNSPPTYEYVMVTWIDEDEDHFEKYPLKNLLLMRNFFNEGRESFCTNNKTIRKDCTEFDFYVVGPWSSATLQTIRAEGNDKKFGLELSKETKKLKKSEKLKPLKTNLPDITFYNTSATYQHDDSAALRYRLPEEKMEELGEEHRFRIRHIVSSDEMLGKALLQELNLRRKFSSQNKIILIGEHDTKYGRELLNILGDDGEKNYQIKKYTYLRGLDGSKAPQEEKPKQAATEEGPSVRQLLIPMKTGNLPEGNNQYDYVVRLATKIEEEDQKPFAIGVLGSDVYDKLILLQELKKHFPDTLFFTTDMEAAYLNARELTGTRNLIVASSHGLMLNSRYQRMTAPFRSNYQTSMFHGVQAILNRRADTGLLLNQSPPRVFEIGWRKAIDLSICDDDQQLALAKKMHPPVRPDVPHWERWQGRTGVFNSLLLLGAFFLEVCRYLILLIGVGFVLTLSTGGHQLYFYIISGEWWINLFRKAESKEEVSISWKRRLYVTIRQFFIVAAIFAFIVYVIVECHFNPQLGSEPFYIFEGVSVWPTVFIHTITAILMGGIIAKVCIHLKKTNKKINEAFAQKSCTHRDSFKSDRSITIAALIGDNIFERKPEINKNENTKTRTFEEWWQNLLRDLKFWKKDTNLAANMKMFYHWFRWIVLSDEDTEKKIMKISGCLTKDQNKPSSGKKGLNEFWQLHSSTSSARRIFIGLATLLIFFIFIPQMAMISSWTSYRGNVVFYFDILVWGLSCFGLILTSVIILVDGLSCHRFIKNISKITLRDQKNEENEKPKDEKIPQAEETPEHAEINCVEERNFQLLKFRLIGTWTKENHFLLAAPMVLLLLLILAKIPLFDAFGSGYWLQLLFVITILILSFFPVARIRLTANRMRRECINHLEKNILKYQDDLIAILEEKGVSNDKKKTNHQNQKGKPERENFPPILTWDELRAKKEQIKESIEFMQTTVRLVREYDEGIFSAYLWHPILPFVVILGSGSLLTPFLFEMFMK